MCSLSCGRVCVRLRLHRQHVRARRQRRRAREVLLFSAIAVRLVYDWLAAVSAAACSVGWQRDGVICDVRPLIGMLSSRVKGAASVDRSLSSPYARARPQPVLATTTSGTSSSSEPETNTRIVHVVVVVVVVRPVASCCCCSARWN